MKITVLEAYTLNPGDLSWDFLSQFGEVQVFNQAPGAKIVEYIGDSEIILINKAQITRNVMDQCPNLKLICLMATGFDCVELQAAKEKGITVCNVPTYGTQSVAQFTFALLLELCHHVGHHSNLVHQGRWSTAPLFCFWDTPQIELEGKTLGIIGFGKIGRAIGKIANAFGMRVLAYNPSECQEGRQIGTYVDMDTLLAESDVITLHCPLKTDNRNMINKDSIEKMKDGAFLINTARGPLVDEQYLADALKRGKLAGAAVDVISKEPMDPTNPLLSAPNCIITPHIAWAPLEARKRILRSIEESIIGFLSGNPCNTVN